MSFAVRRSRMCRLPMRWSSVDALEGSVMIQWEIDRRGGEGAQKGR